MRYLLGFLKNILSRNISKFAIIDKSSTVSSKSRVTRFTRVVDSNISAYSYIAPGSQLLKADIGKFTSIGRDCYLGLSMHPTSFLSTSPIFYSKQNALRKQWTNKNYFVEFDKVTIGNDVWIGNRVTILGGVNVGNGAIIGSGAVVTKNVPDYSIVVGVPARIVRQRFSKEICEKLNQLKWWELSDARLLSMIDVFQHDDVTLEQINEAFYEY